MSVFYYGCMTMDGYIADINHGLDWLYQTSGSEETAFARFYQYMHVAIMGKRTYEAIEHVEDAGSIYPTTQNYVFTHESRLSHKGFIPVRGNVVELVKELGPKSNIWVVGGNTIMAPLLNADMVDYLIIQVAPVLLGEGIPLFTQKEAPHRFHLEEVKRYGQFAEMIYGRAK